MTSAAGSFVGQMWTAWLLDNPANPDVPWYVNFGSFDQGIMSVGGNVTVKAGGDIHDLAVSLPTTAYLDSSNTLHITGGGNLSVTAAAASTAAISMSARARAPSKPAARSRRTSPMAAH